MKIERITYGKNFGGKDIEIFLLKSNGCEVTLTNYGGIISSIKVPDKKGDFSNIVLGFNDIGYYWDESYLAGNPYFGAIIGRYANRIARGCFSLDGKEYHLPINNGPNHLHGGLSGFDQKVWNARQFENDKEWGVEMSYLSRHLEEGYPGNLEVKVGFSLNEENELKIDFSAESDRITVLNLTHHSYFNLNPENPNILGHELKVYSDSYTDTVDLIPTGKYKVVNNTALDFSSPKKIGKDIYWYKDGYDHNFVLSNRGGLLKAAELTEDTTGRKVELYTTQPGLQLYTGYYIPEFRFPGEKSFGRFSGVALEPQHFPDSPNQHGFPPTSLKPGEKYSQQTVYRFGLV
jgi:aldose 1-epimerase